MIAIFCILGYSGFVQLDSKGDRVPVLTLRNFINGEPRIIHTFKDNSTLSPTLTVKWPNGVRSPPRDSPPCGFDGCPSRLFLRGYILHGASFYAFLDSENL